ncbi:MAG: hypothetical protein MUP81_06385 [Dehalococcoidia bacterium]|nr:hypothetical protein [Dehalococcoidia bacterium]
MEQRTYAETVGEKKSPETIIQELEQKDKALFEWIGRLAITDIASQKNAENILTDAKFAQKRATEAQKFLLDPIRESEKRVRDLFRSYLDRLSLGISRISILLSNYHQEQLAMARESETYAAAELVAKIADAEGTGEVVDLTLAETIKAPVKTSRAELGTTSYLEDFDIRIINPDLVSRDLCVPSLSKIRARVKSGVKRIPGVLITPKTILRTTVRK